MERPQIWFSGTLGAFIPPPGAMATMLAYQMFWGNRAWCCCAWRAWCNDPMLAVDELPMAWLSIHIPWLLRAGWSLMALP